MKFHISHGTAHILILMHADRVRPWTVKRSSSISWWDHRSSASLDSAIGTGIYKLLSVFAMSFTPHMSIFYMPTFGNRRNNNETGPISLYFVRLPMLGYPGFASIVAIFGAVNTCVTTPCGHTPDTWYLLHILTSFVYVDISVCSPTGRVMGRELWTSLGDSVAFHSLSQTKRGLRRTGISGRNAGMNAKSKCFCHAVFAMQSISIPSLWCKSKDKQCSWH